MFILELVSKPCDRNERMGKARHVSQSRGWCPLWTIVEPRQHQHMSRGLGVQPVKSPYCVPGQDRPLASGKPLKPTRCEFSLSGSQQLRCDLGTGCVRSLPQGYTEHTEKSSASRDFNFHPFSNSTHFPIPFTFISKAHLDLVYFILHFPSHRGFLLPHGASEAKQNFASPGRRTMSVSRSSASCPCLLQAFFSEVSIEQGAEHRCTSHDGTTTYFSFTFCF